MVRDLLLKWLSRRPVSHQTPHHQETETSEAFSGQPFPDGIKVLHDCPDATMDVCFVHGLTGDRERTWTAAGESRPWPATILPSKLGNTRIMTFGYDAYVVRKSVPSTNRLADHAANLMSSLAVDRASSGASSRPLVLVAHSLGGLVCKEAILLSRNNPDFHLRDLFDSIRGILFLGTPHKGSWMAHWAKVPASIFGVGHRVNTSLLEVMQTDEQYLESLQNRFWSMIREQQLSGRALDVTCFYEELPLPQVGLVVSRDSAVLEGYKALSIHANHRDMAKFGSLCDSGFKNVLGELARWATEVGYSTVEHQSSPALKGEHSEKVQPPGNNFGFGSPYTSTGSIQNISSGSGLQFPGAIFNGSVRFGGKTSQDA